MMSNGKVAMVTGAGSGIGRVVAVALMREGYRVVLTGRREDALQATAALGRAFDGVSLVVAADVTDEGAVEQLFARTDKCFGRLDVLFNNAGIFTPATSLEDLGLAQWRAAVDVNLSGVFLCTRQAFRMMKAQEPRGGRIINNGSISAHSPRPNAAAYTATKHAITGLTKSASLDGRKYDIACGQIDIGNAATDMTQAMSHGVRQADGSVAAEPTMDAGEVARAVVYMASLPLQANVQFMTVMATKMPFIGRG